MKQLFKFVIKIVPLLSSSSNFPLALTNSYSSSSSSSPNNNNNKRLLSKQSLYFFAKIPEKMVTDGGFSEEEMAVEPGLGYPRAYAKLCKDRRESPYSYGPPFTFIPYNLKALEAKRAKELDEMFPIIDPQAKPTTKPKIFLSLLWKQLNHLGNAGFDPAVFRVDPYGNVLYYHADPTSPLAWEIDHWFPCSRGGSTVPSNLRILQWQVYKRKHNQLEFLVPWWDLQLGISINQFLSFFTSSNSDFRHRAFSLLFKGGESEELNELQTVESHNFPQPFMDSKEKLGLAPAAIVLTRRDAYGGQPRPIAPIVAARKSEFHALKENQNPNIVSNPYQAIVMARDSLKQKEETAKMKMEIQRLDQEANGMKQKNEEEKMNIQELEMTLIKCKRKAEKCHKLAEAQSSYRTMLEKMIRDAMHQSVVYKEQVRLNQAAANALMARLEAQKALCNSAEKELHKKFKQRDNLEKQIQHEWEQTRKRLRMDDNAFSQEEKNGKTVLYLPGSKPKTHLHKELRVLLEEHKLLAETKQEEIEEEHGESSNHGREVAEDFGFRFPDARDQESEEDEEARRERGKGNVEKWLQILLKNEQERDETSATQPIEDEPETSNKTDEIVRKLNEKYPLKELKMPDDETEKTNTRKPRSISAPRRSAVSETNKVNRNLNQKYPQKETEVSVDGTTDTNTRKPRPMSTPGRSSVSETSRGNETPKSWKGIEIRKSFGGGKEKELARSESARNLKSIPSSPLLILGMKKGVDCIRKKPLVIDDDSDENNNHVGSNKNLLKSSIKSIKKAVKM